eukprot:gene7428-biopygen6056
MCPSNDSTNIIGHVLQLPPAMVERVGVGSGGGSCVVLGLAAVAEATVAAVAQLSGSTIPLVPILHCACSGARAAPLWGGGCAPRRAAPRRSAPGGACGRRGRVERQGMEHQLATPGENCVQSPGCVPFALSRFAQIAFLSVVMVLFGLVSRSG